LRQAYRQGYLNAVADSEGDEWHNAEYEFDDWLHEALAENSIGDLQIVETEQ
jgi:hypothetical protein